MDTRKSMLLGLAVACVALVGLIGPATAEEETEDQVTEKVVAWESLPEAVQATIHSEAGDHTIGDVEEVRDQKLVYFEADWIEGENEVEIHVAPDGKLLSRAIEKAQAEDLDEGHDPDDED